MLRVISRPITVPAERIALLNAGLPMTFSTIPGSGAFSTRHSPDAVPPSYCGTGGGRSTGSDGATLALSRS